MRPRSYYGLPELPDAGLLTRYMGTLAVIVPVARTNLITNPSFETNTTNWTAIGGSIARSTTQQYHGAYSLAVTPTAGTSDGARYDTVSLTSGTSYGVSCKSRGVAGVAYKLSIATTGGVDLAVYRFTATGNWQWLTLIYTETSTTTRRVVVSKDNSASTGIFYIDGVQVEACGSEGTFVTTYIDGDQAGLVPNQQPPAYGWNGTAHASTSYRVAQTRAGGRVIRFRDLGFLLTAIIGLALVPPEHQALTFAQLDGGQYLNTLKPPRQFSLTGRWGATTPSELDIRRGQLAHLLDRDLVGLRQPLVLTMQAEECGAAVGDVTCVQALYSGGMEGSVEELPSASSALTFTQYLPMVLGHDQGAALASQISVANANNIVKRAPDGVWSALGSGVNGAVNAVAKAPDGSVYVAGAFTTASGTTVNGIAKWNPVTNTWSALGTGLSGGLATGYALAVAPNGDIYLGGSFTAAGGTAAANIAKWNGSAWSALGSGTNNAVGALAFGPDGSLYLGGSFTAAGGIANTRAIAKWNGAAYSALGTGAATTVVQALLVAPDGSLYAGGSFTGMGGVANTANIARWNGSAWLSVGDGMDNAVGALAATPNGIVYAGGTFLTAGGVAANQIAKWNGQVWQPLDVGTNGVVYSLAVANDGTLWVGGTFTTAGGITLPDRLARWNGSAWVLSDIDLPGTPLVQTLVVMNDGSLYLGSTTSGAAAAAATTTVTNNGTAATYPRLTITDPSGGGDRLYQIINTTTGAAIYFNYTIQQGEIAVLTFKPTNVTFVSTFQGNILDTILPGSNTTGFSLQPGANTISYFASNSGVTGVLDWQIGYTDLSDALYQTAP